MKVLSTEQQTDLRNLLTSVADTLSDQDLANELAYWATELKPKRVRRKDGGTVLSPLTDQQSSV